MNALAGDARRIQGLKKKKGGGGFIKFGFKKRG
jgi:hypothetical protein